MSPEVFLLSVPEATLSDLAQRLDSTRLEPAAGADDWDAGTSPTYLAELVEYWRTKFDWRAQEKKLNAWPHYRIPIDGHYVHFVHQRGRGPAPMPLLLTHGYPDSWLRFEKLIPLLTDPAAHGADPADAFEVVAPSLPGYPFSEPRDADGSTFDIGNLWHRLMSALGHEKYGAHGGDWGSTVTEHLARSHSSSVLGIHLTDVPFWHAFQKPDDPTPAETKLLDENERFQKSEGAYAMIQGTRPATLAAALEDSPAGMAAWIVEKFQRWSDCDGDVERRFSKDELLTNIVLHWASHSLGSSFQPYYDFTHARAPRWILEKAKEWVGSTKTPAGFALFPHDLTRPPREWAQRFFNVVHWTEMPRGGHFAAMEQPKLLAEDLRAFFRPLRSSTSRAIADL